MSQQFLKLFFDNINIVCFLLLLSNLLLLQANMQVLKNVPN